MNIQKIHISKLKAAEYNPRVALKAGDKEYEKLKRSIQEFGFVEPIVWNIRTGNVVGGHQRLTVLKDYGNKPSETYEQLKTQFDGYAKYDNNGKEKVLVEKYETQTASKAFGKQSWWETNLDSNKKYPLMRDEVITKKRKDGKAICLFLPVEGAEKGKCADFWVATSQVSIEQKDGKAYVAAITKVGAKDSSYLRKSINIKFAQGKKETSAQSTDDSANVLE